MKNKTKKNQSTNPYRSLSIEPVSAPSKPKAEPKASVIRGKGDLRGDRK